MPIKSNLMRLPWQKIGLSPKLTKNRFECYLYRKFIAIVLGGYIQNLFNGFVEEKMDFELSEWKAYKILKKTLKSFGDISENKWMDSEIGQRKILKNYGMELKKKRKRWDKNTISRIQSLL